MKTLMTAAVAALLLMPMAVEASSDIEDAIKFRQSGYTFMSWNMARIRANVEGQYNAEEVQRAANAIAAIANSGMGTLFVPGSDQGSGWKPTRARSNLFTDSAGVAKVATDFNREANEMARIAAGGDAAAVRAQFGKLGASCKACHDKYRGPSR